MGKAHAAPGLKDVERVDVTTHAVEKMFERLPLGSHYRSMPEKDLRLRVEESWKSAKRAGEIEEWYESVDGKIVLNHVVDFSDAFDAELVGLFRDDSRQPGKPVLITTLTRAMAELNKTSNKWAKSPEKVNAKELLSTPMKDSLQHVVIPPQVGSKEARPVLEENRQVQITAQAKEAARLQEMEALRKMVVTFDHPHTGDPLVEFTTKGKVQEVVNKLVEQGVDESTIQIWVKAEAKMKKMITIDF